MTLPIEPILPGLRDSLRARPSAVLVAPPGAGKTTRVPLALLDEPWLAGQKILMLEPRRLAARAAARFMATRVGESVGETVGYRVRLESRVGPKTRIEVITEGILTRMLQADQALEGIGLVIFDEFHERSLHADLGLALCLQSQALLREDLRILVMSATLEAEPVAALLGDAPILISEGRSYPVETRHFPRPVDGRVEPVVVRAINEALASDEGDLLVFLPGQGEIRRVAEQLGAQSPGPTGQSQAGRGPAGQRLVIAPLYGNLPQEAQDRAIAPSRPGERKIVLASNIAETSLTVEGVRIVIDSGLMRAPRFSPRTGMTRLETLPISRAAADQRRGRAGRLAPGVCYRLWTEQEERHMVARATPEILEADLAPLALELAAWGVADPSELAWLDPPPPGALAQARELLTQLGALTPEGSPTPAGAPAITPHGRQMAEAGLHPRLAHMILKAIPLGMGRLACELAALLSERDLFRAGPGGPRPDADLRLRVEALQGRPQPYSIDQGAAKRVRAEAQQQMRTFGIDPQSPADPDQAGLLLAFAYPDRIAQRRSAGRFLLRNGRGAILPDAQPLMDEPYLVAAELDDQGPESRIFLAAPVALNDLEAHHGEQITAEVQVYWDPEARAVRARRRERLGALILRAEPLPKPGPAAVTAALLDGIAAEGLAILPWTKASRQLQERLIFLSRLDPAWPDASDEALRHSLPDWLGPHLDGCRSEGDLQRLHLAEILEAMLPWERRRELNELAPTHITVPSGSRIPIDYSDPAQPVLSVRLQEVFGLPTTPRVARGRVPLTMHLLSPAHRPVQVTQDLASFWRSAYFEVRKDLRGRYPKHYWPEDPLTATPTNRAKPRT